MAENLYHKWKRALKALKCPECDGLGVCDDAEPGDTDFNQWDCPECDGKGVRLKTAGQKMTQAELPRIVTGDVLRPLVCESPNGHEWKKGDVVGSKKCKHCDAVRVRAT